MKKALSILLALMLLLSVVPTFVFSSFAEENTDLASGDGWYDGMDAMIVSCLANGMLTESDVSEAEYMAADCNHDGVIDQLDVDILQQAGVLLSQIDQSKSEEELLETSSAYVEYLNLIDQNVDNGESAGESDNNPTVEPTDGKINVFEWLINFVVRIFNYLKLNFAILK